MAEEKRKIKRMELSVSAQLKNINLEGTTRSKDLEIEVVDISRKGIGFKSKEFLAKNNFYNAKIEIWTKEVIDTIISIVRIAERDGEFYYGGIFIGMADIDARKFDIYQMFHEE